MAAIKKHIQYYSWMITALAKRYAKLILVGFLAGLALFILGVKAYPHLRARAQTDHKIVGLVGQYTPSNLPFSIQRLISIGLTDVDQTGTVIAALATTWEATDGGKTFTFHLKPNILWHDAKRFTAHDINYNLKDVEFVVVDDETFTVKLKDAFAPLPNYLSKPLFKQGLIGVGSYKIDAIKLKGEFVTHLTLAPLSPELPAMEVRFYPTESVAKTAFKLGEINVLDEIVEPAPFESWPLIEIVENPSYNQYIGVFFNLTDSLLKDKDIRQALSYAVNKDNKHRLITPLSSQSWAYTNRVKDYAQDVQKAKKMLADKKVESGTTITISTVQQHYELAQRIAKDWEAVGLTPKIKVENGIPSEFQVLLITQEIPPDPDQYSFWHSTQNETNITHYTNPKIDKLLEDGRKELDTEKRTKIYFDFQRYLVEDAPAIFLHHPSTFTILRK